MDTKEVFQSGVGDTAASIAVGTAVNLVTENETAEIGESSRGAGLIVAKPGEVTAVVGNLYETSCYSSVEAAGKTFCVEFAG